MTDATNSQTATIPGTTMRPNIQISHALNGRVKDYAAEHDLSAPEAYEEIIRVGLDVVTDEDPVAGGDDTRERARGNSDDTQDAPAAETDSAPSPPSHDELLSAAYDGKEQADERAAIGSVALSWLQSRDEPVTASDFKQALYESHQLDDESADTWWRKNARPAITEARDAGLVEYHDGKKTYRWVGE